MTSLTRVPAHFDAHGESVAAFFFEQPQVNAAGLGAAVVADQAHRRLPGEVRCAVQDADADARAVRIARRHPLRVGDRLSITIGPYQFDVQVLALNELRRPASEARLLYEESAESIAQRQRQREMKKMADGGFSAPDRRPGKRDRRKIRDFTGKN